MTKPTIKLSDIRDDAEYAFWAEVVKHLPKAQSGDFPPDADHQYSMASEEAIITWWRYNAEQHYNLQLWDGEILTEEKENDQ